MAKANMLTGAAESVKSNPEAGEVDWDNNTFQVASLNWFGARLMTRLPFFHVSQSWRETDDSIIKTRLQTKRRHHIRTNYDMEGLPWFMK